MKEANKVQRLPLELREVLNTTCRSVNVIPALHKAAGMKITKEFLEEFNRRDAERNFRQTEVLFYEFGCEYLNPILNTLSHKPAEHNAFHELLLDCLSERMRHIRIAHEYREKRGLGRWTRESLTYEYDADKYPYV